MRRRIFIVVNPTAGSPRRELLAAVLGHLRAAGADITLIEPDQAALASDLVGNACADHDVIVAAGGDGTVRQVAAAISGSGRPLGLIPLGTGNVLAREIGLGSDPQGIADTLIHGRITEVEGGIVNRQPFYLMVGVGFDGRAVDLLDQHRKRRLGRAAYAGPLLRSWWRAPDEFAVTIDGHGHSANWLIVTNVQHYAGNFVLTRATSIFKPGLKGILIRAATRADLALRVWALARGGLTTASSPAVQVLDFETMHIAAANVPVQVDGDRFGCTPLTITDGGSRLRLLVPTPRPAAGPSRR